MSRIQQIHIQTNRPRNARRQLPEERISSVDICAFAKLGSQHPTLQWRLTWIVRCKQRREMAVPIGHEIQTALLHPSLKILLRNLVGGMKDAVIRRENLDRCLF